MSLDGYPIVIHRRIDWGEMDAMMHVNNVVYFRWFESGRVALFDAMKVLQHGARGVEPILKSIGCTFRAPLTYPDAISIGVRVKDVGDDRFTVEHVAFSERLDRIAAQGDGVVVAYDYDKGEKARIPDAWRAAFDRIAQGAQ